MSERGRHPMAKDSVAITANRSAERLDVHYTLAG
jgi:hypothetical protein